MKIRILRDYNEFSVQAASWFHEKWGIPLEAYKNSIDESIKQQTGVPQWYILLDENNSIVAGAGVIENDFHDRKDLAPNLCALFVEEEYRSKGIAKEILDFVRRDFAKLGFTKLYLITDHINFYEKCGWEFLTEVIEDDGKTTRMYTALTGN